MVCFLRGLEFGFISRNRPDLKIDLNLSYTSYTPGFCYLIYPDRNPCDVQAAFGLSLYSHWNGYHTDLEGTPWRGMRGH